MFLVQHWKPTPQVRILHFIRVSQHLADHNLAHLCARIQFLQFLRAVMFHGAQTLISQLFISGDMMVLPLCMVHGAALALRCPFWLEGRHV